MALYSSCDGNWERLATLANLDFFDVQLFLDYAAIFLSNMGNYYVRFAIASSDISKVNFSAGLW